MSPLFALLLLTLAPAARADETYEMTFTGQAKTCQEAKRKMKAAVHAWATSQCFDGFVRQQTLKTCTAAESPATATRGVFCVQHQDRATPRKFSAAWKSAWDECRDLSDPAFKSKRDSYKKFVKRGDSWQLGIDQEKVAVKQITTITCPKYLENPNGEEALRDFLGAYTQVTTQAIASKKSADELQAFIKDSYNQAAGSMGHLSFDLGQFPCGKSLSATSKHVSSEVAEVEKLFQELRTKCPAIAKLNEGGAQNKNLSAALAKDKTSAAKPVPSGSATRPASTITGVQEDLNKQKKLPSNP